MSLLGGYQAMQSRVEERVPRLFDHLPKAGLRIIGEFPDPGSPAPLAWYSPPGTGGRRPALFHVNLSLEPEHTREEMETLFLREGLPGRHLQTGLAREADSLAGHVRFGSQPGFVKAWADYAACLGDLLGLRRFRTGDGGPILRLRESTRKVLGIRFDLREFHRRVLCRGPVPLDLLERDLELWARGQEPVKPDSHSSRRVVSLP